MSEHGQRHREIRTETERHTQTQISAETESAETQREGAAGSLGASASGRVPGGAPP